MAKRYNYSFVNKKTGIRQKRPLFLALLSFLLFAVSLIISVIFGGKGGTIIGAFGLVGILLALWGFAVSIRLLMKRMNGRIVFAGAVSCAVMFIVWLAMFLLGVR